MRQVKQFALDYFVLGLGLDTAKGDPIGSWSLRPQDFVTMGKLIGALHFPTLVVQEGGYKPGRWGTMLGIFSWGYGKARMRGAHLGTSESPLCK